MGTTIAIDSRFEIDSTDRFEIDSTARRPIRDRFDSEETAHSHTGSVTPNQKMKDKKAKKKGWGPFPPVHRGSTLYEACHHAFSPPKPYSETMRRRVADHLAQIILIWAHSLGAYDPSIPFSKQQTGILRLVEVHEPPLSLKFPIDQVRPHVKRIILSHSLDRYENHIRHQSKRMKKRTFSATNNLPKSIYPETSSR